METKKPSDIKLFDYGKSFVQTENNPENTPRFLVESRCVIIDGDNTEEYYLAARCKGEHTFDYQDLFESKCPFDFFPLFNKKETLVFRKFKFYLPGEVGEYKKKYGSSAPWGDKVISIKEIEPI
jgi:hypothetical protein